jgi:hypothetical protein
MKSNPLGLFVLLVLLHGRLAVAQSTVNFTAGPQERDVTHVNTTPVPTGTEVWLGFFTSGFDVAANGLDLSALAAEWHLYGETTTRNIFGEDGRFGATVSSLDPVFDGHKAWLWVLETSDTASPQANFNNVSHYGLFSSQAANWIFPAHDAIPPGDMVSLNSSEATEAVHGFLSPNHLMLTAVPEPSVFAFLALGIVGLTLSARLRKGDEFKR